MAVIPPSPIHRSIFSLAFQEVLGSSLLEFSHEPFEADNLDSLCGRLESEFTLACACGLAQQIGRSAFTLLLRDRQDPVGLTDQSFRLLPGRQRIRKGLEKLEILIESVFNVPVTVIDEGDVIRLKTTGPGRQSLLPHLEAGFVQEFIHWISGGRPHLVRVCQNDPGWSVKVGKQPLDS